MICLRSLLTTGRTPVSSAIRCASSSSNGQDLISPGDQRSVRIHTCRKTYSALGRDRPYIFRKCPSAGIDMQVQFLDTDPHASPSVPTIMAVHGAPGNFADYAPVIHKLRQKGFRIIAPNFPGIRFTDETETFRHTTEEKAEFLTDWLDEIGVERIDVAVMHSSAVYPTLKIWDDRPGLLRSLVMINPAGHRRIKAMKPEWFVSSIARVNMHPLGRKFFSSLGSKIAAAFGVAVKVERDHSDNAALACLTMYLAKVQRLEQYLRKLNQNKVPTAYFFSERDKLVDTQIFYEMLQILGADKSMITMSSKDGHITQEAVNSGHDWLRVIDVKDGGHYAFKSYADLLDDEITKLLTKVYETDVVSIEKLAITDSPLEDYRQSSVYAVNFKRF